MATLKVNSEAWNHLSREAIKQIGIPAMKRVADAANEADGLEDGYRVSNEGDKPLRKNDFRVSVITATAKAMAKNAKHNTLVNEFSKAAED